VESELIRYGPAKASALLLNSNFSHDELQQALAELQSSGRIVIVGEIAVDSGSWKSMMDRATGLIESVHQTSPERAGLDLSELRAGLPELDTEALEGLIAHLCQNGFVRRGAVIARATHRPSLPPTLDRSAKQILAALLEKPLDPPARARIAPDPTHQQAVRYLIDQGEIVDLGTDVLLSGEAFAKAKEQVVRFITARGSASVSELREALQTSRRIAVPLLERLDREQVTKRLGDRRVLSHQINSKAAGSSRHSSPASGV
jgi:selenocysteine-specific elongation factor